MYTRKVYLTIIIAAALLSSACGTSRAIPPTATPLPPTSTNIPPTSTSAPPTSTTVPPTKTATQTPTAAPTRISPAPQLDPTLGRVEGVLSHRAVGPLAKYHIALLDPNKDTTDPTAYIVKGDTGKDGYYFLDGKPGTYTLDVSKLTHVGKEYPCLKASKIGEVQFSLIETPPYQMFYGYGQPKQNDWIVSGSIENLILEAGKVIEINIEIDC